MRLKVKDKETILKKKKKKVDRIECNLLVFTPRHGNNMLLLETTKTIVNHSLVYRKIPTAGFH